jgi:Dihydrodipicolinate reductase
MRTAEAIGAARGETAASSDAGRLELVPGARGGEYCGVRIHSVRLPGHVAHQEVIFGRLGETLRIRHDLTDRRAFVPGVLLAIRRVGALRGVHGLEELLFPAHDGSPRPHPYLRGLIYCHRTRNGATGLVHASSGRGWPL